MNITLGYFIFFLKWPFHITKSDPNGMKSFKNHIDQDDVTKKREQKKTSTIFFLATNQSQIFKFNTIMLIPIDIHNIEREILYNTIPFDVLWKYFRQSSLSINFLYKQNKLFTILINLQCIIDLLIILHCRNFVFIYL